MPQGKQDPALPALKIRERYGLPVKHFPFETGIPLPRGFCFNPRQLSLRNENGQALECAFTATMFWPDRSIRWCSAQLLVNLAPDEELQLTLSILDTQPTPSPPISLKLDLDEKCLEVNLQSRSYQVNTSGTFRLSLIDTFVVSLSLSSEGVDYPATVHSHTLQRINAGSENQWVAVQLNGQFEFNQQRLHFDCKLQLTNCGSRINGQVTVHNPAAADHPNGLWDLGDPASLYFDSIDLQITKEPATKATPATALLSFSPDSAPVQLSDATTLTQYASGGDMWNSPVHVDKLGRNPIAEPGFLMQTTEKEERGQRANPQLLLPVNDEYLAITLHDFWQKFPSGLSVDDYGATVGLLPKVNYAHEIQPGEKLSKEFCLEILDTPQRTGTSICAALNPEFVASCRLPALTETHVENGLKRIVAEGLDGTGNFFDKREAIDEYGWRHFGELYADHETDGYTGEKPFVSHYNNQYDPLYGFLRQYLCAGDQRWFELADDLANHIVDIDIYHTQEDRPEYNGGLFWHTDHYLPAETATHRSYSRHQPKDAYEGHARGGGPGGQHCYTSGLQLHYLLTGNQRSLQALYTLRDWIEILYEGGGTLVDVALAIKNRNRGDLKNHLTGRYPLDRGVANYLVALMDCFELDQRQSTLNQVEMIIQNTVHPRDDIDARDLGNVEETWFYVVFLQAVCRYLEIKLERNEADEAMSFARDSLLHYACWMCENEAPYLEKPEILEFPNHTWAAQDLRKANVLLSAARWTNTVSDAELFRSNGMAFVTYVCEALITEPTRCYTRIQALVLQNLNPTLPLPDAIFGSKTLGGESENLPAIDWGEYRQPALVNQAWNLLKMTAKALKNFKPKRELDAIRRVLPSSAKADIT